MATMPRKQPRLHRGTVSQVTQSYPSALVRVLVEEWLEAYDSGWRPNMYIESEHDRVADFVRKSLSNIVTMDDIRRDDG